VIPQTRSFIITFEDMMRDVDRRILAQERRTQYAVTADLATLATVQTIAEVVDSAIWYYVLDDGLVHHAGTTTTYAAWLASLP
jgi:hypothetical protein